MAKGAPVSHDDILMIGSDDFDSGASMDVPLVGRASRVKVSHAILAVSRLSSPDLSQVRRSLEPAMG